MKGFARLADEYNDPGLLDYPALKFTYDGTNDYSSVNNSGTVSSPFDLDYNQVWSIAVRCHPTQFTQGKDYCIFSKWDGTNVKGYFLQMTYNTDGWDFVLQLYSSGSNGRYLRFRPLSAVSDTILIFTNDGLNTTTSLKLHAYNSVAEHIGDGLLVLTPSNVANPFNATIRNTVPFLLGGFSSPVSRFFVGDIGNLIVFNKTLSFTEATETASNIASDLIEINSSYANITALLREHGQGFIKNHINTTYNATITT